MKRTSTLLLLSLNPPTHPNAVSTHCSRGHQVATHLYLVNVPLNLVTRELCLVPGVGAGSATGAAVGSLRVAGVAAGVLLLGAVLAAGVLLLGAGVATDALRLGAGGAGGASMTGAGLGRGTCRVPVGILDAESRRGGRLGVGRADTEEDGGLVDARRAAAVRVFLAGGAMSGGLSTFTCI